MTWLQGFNYWLAKFIQEVANKKGGRYPPRTLYGVVCGLKRHSEVKAQYCSKLMTINSNIEIFAFVIVILI